MRKLEFEQVRLAAVVGGVVGSIGGLLVVGIVTALLSQEIRDLFRVPIQSLISWLICTPVGWFLGGLIAARKGGSMNSRNGEIILGALGGALPVLAIAVVAWYIGTHL